MTNAKKMPLQPQSKSQNDDFNYAAPVKSDKNVSVVEIKSSWLGYGISEPRLNSTIIIPSLVINLLALATPLVILQVYDRIIPNQSRATLWILFAAVMAILVLDFALKVLRNYALSYSATNFTHTMSVEAMNRILHAPFGSVEKQALSTQMNRFNALLAVGEYHSSQSRTTAIDMPFVVIFLGLMTLVGGYLVLVPMVLFTIFGLFSISQNKKMNTALNERIRIDNRKYDFLIESLSGITTIKSLAIENAMQRRYERLQLNCADSTYTQVSLSNKIQDVSVFFGSIAQIAVVSVGAIMTINNHLSMGALACCTLLSGQVLQPLLRGIVVWTDYQNLTLRRNDAAELYKLPEVTKAETKTLEESAIILRNVTHSHGKQPIVTNATAKFQANKITGIFAQNDAARHGLLRLIRGEHEQHTGNIFVAGLDTRTPEFNGIKSQITYVNAQAQMFRGTILENLTHFEISKKRQAAVEAARIVGIEKEINQLPEGYDTKLGESAANDFGSIFLQKIAIARALTTVPEVLILDNVTDNFDDAGIAQFKQMLNALRGRITVVLATANPKILPLADEVFALMNDGTLKEAKLQNSAAVKTA